MGRSRQQLVKLGGNRWSFDALRGSKLFLIKTLKLGYQVRSYDLATNTLSAAPLKDPGESATISGFPFARVSSPDRRYLFTLYLGSGGGAMIHELDLAAGTARCVDLPGDGDYAAATTWALVVDPDGRTLWAVSPGYGRVVGIDVLSRKVTTAFSIDVPNWSLGDGTRAAISPDGKQFAIADGTTVALVDLTRQRIVQRRAGKASALGYSPEGRLWRLS